MKRNRDTRAIRERLAGAERGLQHMQTTKNKDDRRVMLGCLLFDLLAIEKTVARDGCSEDERARLEALTRQAWEMQRQIGTPIKDPSNPFATTRKARIWRSGYGPRSPQAAAAPPVAEDPVLAFWLSQGFTHRAATGLRRANVRSLDEMALLSVEKLMEIPGIGSEEARRCEVLLGGALRGKARYWTSRGLSGRTAGSLVRAGIETLDDLARMTRKELLLVRGLGEDSLRQCEALLGRPLASPEDDWLKAGCPQWLLARKLVRAKVLTVEDLGKLSSQELSAAGLTRREIEQCKRIVKKAKRKSERV